MENQEHIIIVDGSYSMEVTPDQLVMQVDVKSSYKTTEEANNALFNDINQINQILNELNLDDVKAEICSMDVNKKMYTVYDKNNNATGEKVGAFCTTLTVIMKMDANRPNVKQLASLIGKKLKDAEIDITYELKDHSNYKLKVLSGAVKEAQMKAKVITDTCGYKLESIQKITEKCGCHENKSQNRNPLSIFSGFSAPAPTADAKPKKVQVWANVNIIWNIEKKED